MSDARSVLTERIAFAEEWLDQAKRQLADGNVANGSLHMILAEAELQRAREVNAGSVSPDPLPAPSTFWSVLSTRGVARASAGVLAVAGFAAALLWHMPVVREAAPADTSWPVVVLSEQTGDMLRLVGTPSAPEPLIVERTVERTIVKPMIVRVPAASQVRLAAAAAAPPIAPVAAGPRAARAPGPVVVAPQPAHAPATQSTTASEAPPAAPVISDADVIDLVLAAERSLRQPAKH